MRTQGPSDVADSHLGADREFALIHTPARLRNAFLALWRLDVAMGDVVARSTEPALAAIKLAWWRERLDELAAKVPAEPRLKFAAEALLPRGVTGAQLAAIEPGWATLLDAEPDPALVAERGRVLFAIGSQLLQSNADVSDAGALYALAAVGRRGMPQLFIPARELLPRLAGRRFPRQLRPLTMLARAAARDLRDEVEPEGSPARLTAMLGHRWSGRIA
ncbi:hypothetical protein G7078_05995 [Sphingomonas sinipercae]|uniref:Phytoene synthase n=1 Tax=Sphingomonas sinipercae TaxID=2714944 RepID=A0A6G7ZNA8_9SPHN|nr:hypothetical protein [Sphingomonas sinipercae]QIL02386.1 hypothetical protein G7078_05995 [Sphingomonas sinipercae]